MSVQVEKLEKNMAKLTIEVPAERLNKALNEAYLKTRGRIAVPGFRKGKAPRKVIERLYGAAAFYDDAANLIVPEAYEEAVKECGEEIVSRPAIDITQMEEGKPFIFTAEVAVKPEVTLGQYKGIEVETEPVEVTDEEAEQEVRSEQEKQGRDEAVTDRPVQNGDRITLDFDGSVDGVPFEGGKADDYPLTIGSGSFIPGFEEQLIGMQIGEEKDVVVTFPEQYQEASLAGKEAVFKCTVKGIRERQLPQLDDEFAQDAGYDNMDEMRESLRGKLLERKQKAADSAKEDAVITKIIENAQMDIPEAMIDWQVEQMLDDFRARVEQQGMKLEQYLSYLGTDRSGMAQQMRPQALRRIQSSLVLEAVSKAEAIEISQEKIDEELAKMAESYQMEVDKLKEMMGETELEQMKSDMAVQQAVELVRDSAVEVPKKQEEAAE